MYYTIQVTVDQQTQRTETGLDRTRAKRVLDEVLTSIEKKQGLQDKLLTFPGKKKLNATNNTNRAYSKNRVVQVTQRF